jgi:phosphoribosylaminoimidazolecarboxamide formyltransferase/IMP cyclohydrolase
LEDNPLLGAACASDAFFPFPDAVERLGRMGVKAIVQPYGSIRDGLVIDEANRHGIAMPATLERCFGHF